MLPLSATEDAVAERPSSDLPAARESDVRLAERRRPLLGWGAGVLALLALLFATGYWQRRRATSQLAIEASLAQRALPSVVVISPRPSRPTRSLALPATLEGLEQTEVNARADGYVRSWQVDLGDSVEQGQVLAELDTPELDREIEQARARLAESEAAILEASATRDFSRSNLARYRDLAPEGIASQQEVEQKQSQSKVDQAHVAVVEADRNSQLANLHRLEQLKAFARVVAPFRGTITERSVVRGKLVSAGAGQPLFKIASLDPLRAFVQVPQSLVAGLKEGLPAELRVAEQRGRVWSGTVARTASALDAVSRTMKVEVRVPNADHRLLPGMYSEVTLQLEGRQSTLVLPGSALSVGKEGVRVAVVTPSGRVHWSNVHVERDDGAEVEISEGLSSSDSVIVTPGPDLVEGTQIRR